MDDIYRVWFKADTVKVNVELEEKKDFLSVEEIVALTGAPGESDILVRQVGRIIQFRISNQIFAEDMYRYLVADAGGMSYYLDNVVMVLKEAFTNKGIGPRCVIKEIHAAGRLRDELPIRCIQVDAVGNYDSFFWEKDPLRGYYVWPCMGFDAEIPDSVKSKLPRKFHHTRYLSELMFDKDGRREWLIHGESTKLSFDLAPDSCSWKLLSQYMREKGIGL